MIAPSQMAGVHEARIQAIVWPLKVGICCNDRCQRLDARGVWWSPDGSVRGHGPRTTPSHIEDAAMTSYAAGCGAHALELLRPPASRDER